MLKNNRIKYIITIFSISTCIISLIFFILAAHYISLEFINVIGEGAMDSASLLAKHITLSNKDVDKLVNMEYSNIASYSKNQELQSLIENIDFAYDFDCVYVVHRLKPNEIKYTINEENKDFFKSEVGTPLDIIWLLDVPILATDEMSYEEYFSKDIERYTYSNDHFTTLSNEIKPSFSFIEDEYGRVISSCVPLWSLEGDFIGYLGLDIRMDTYKHYRDKIILLLGILFLCTTISLSFIFSNVYLRSVKKSRKKIYYDTLTNTYNRRYYDECFENIMNSKDAMNSFVSVMMIDVDDFKKINDKYGHEKGDQCLRKISEIFTKSSVDILIRYGGDEFIAGCFTMNKQRLTEIMDSIMYEISLLNLFNDKNKITLSIGICTVYKDGFYIKDFNKLISRADENLYIAKKNGRNQYYITEYTSCS